MQEQEQPLQEQGLSEVPLPNGRIHPGHHDQNENHSPATISLNDIMMEPDPEVNVSSTEDIVESSLPVFTDSAKKMEYLKYRSGGFTVLEACKMVGCHLKSVSRWRKDPKFARIDMDGITEERKKLAAEFLNIEFGRNFTLIMKKDAQVLLKSLQDNYILTPVDAQYLMKLRSHYTPQALAMMKQLLSGGDLTKPFDFTEVIMTLRKERQEITFEARKERTDGT